ncbi:MAG: hypothetical protein JST62_07140 [Bacteroidetes bacterium]|nr:hypothetical protein [Bacteroidota bacterium]
MKKIDIEQIERKNIGEIPDGFFEEMQSVVLAKTVHKNENINLVTKKNTKTLWYGIAASITILLSLVVVLPNISTKKTEVSLSNVEKQSIYKEAPSISPTVEIVENTIATPKTMISENRKNTILKSEISEKVVSPTNNKNNNQLDLVLADMSNKELSELSNRAEQDIYLDIY